VLIADAGNFTSYNRREGADFADCMLKGMGKIGYDVVTISNKDLSNGIELLRNAEATYGLNFVSSNIYSTQTGRPLFNPYIIKRDHRLKVGIFGLTEELYWRDKPLMDSLKIEVRPYREIASEIVKRLRGKVDYLVLLTDLRLNSLDSLLSKNPGIDLVITTGSYQPGVRKNFESPTLEVGTGHRGYTGNLLEIPFRPQRSDTAAYHEVETDLTQDVASDSALISLISDCKPQPQTPAAIKATAGQTSLYHNPAGSQTQKNGQSAQDQSQVRKSPFPKPVTRTVPPPTATKGEQSESNH
jgi:2',3'-cyclic-nucleotide 2'-phosphodiesterase (5'-nucleotidase family)